MSKLPQSPATSTDPSAAGVPTPVDVVVHTHWDREWYMDRETTLARLQAVMDRVADELDAGRLAQFLFDGQTVALEDLRSHAPATLMQRLRVHAQAGRLILGPWYVASDEFLVSGESLLRNLALGTELSDQWSGAQALGYLPDTFGHVAQMPQILQQFGIAHAVVWRGVDASVDLFDWHAPNGPSVASVYLTEGYYLHPLHGPDWSSATQDLLQRLLKRRDPAAGGPLLLTHGGDHLAPHPQLLQRMQAFNRLQTGFELRQRTLFEHAQQVCSSAVQRPVIQGELRSNRSAFVLPDVLSTRRHLKRMHQAAEDRLLGAIEPLMAKWGADPAALDALDRAWRVLLQQQAHDSICGCSTDEVHAEMVLRFQQLHRSLDALQRRLMHRAGMIDWDRHLTANSSATSQTTPERVDQSRVFADDTCFTLFNPLPRARQGWFEVSLFLHGPRRDHLRIQNAQGHCLPVQILSAQESFELVSPLDEFPERMNGWRYAVALNAELEGLGALPLWVDQVASQDDSTQSTSQGAEMESSTQQEAHAAIQNAAWRVELDAQGRLLLSDLLQTAPTPRQLSVMSEMDAGDTYNHSPLAGAKPVVATHWHCVAHRTNGSLQELRLNVQLVLPAGLNDDRSGPSSSSVVCEGELTLYLLGDEPLLRLSLKWHNRARDQRTRLVLGGVPHSCGSTWRDTAFAWTQHPVVLSQIPAAVGRGEAPVCVQPSLSALAVGPWRVVHRALHEHEIILDPIPPAQADATAGAAHVEHAEHAEHAERSAYALGITLVRSVGWMSRRDLRTRGVGAGPDLPTPQAQCLGEDHFELMLLAHSNDSPAHDTLRAAQALRRPLMALRGHARFDAASLNLNLGPLEVSACRRLGNAHLELRLWNPTDASVALKAAQEQWVRVWANGEPHGLDHRLDHGLDHGVDHGTVQVEPHEIITLQSTHPWGDE